MIFGQFFKAKNNLPKGSVLAQELRASPQKLQEHVLALTGTSRPRDYSNAEAIEEAAQYIKKAFEEAGVRPEFQNFKAGSRSYRNVVAVFGPREASRIVIGAHYDVAGNQPGADDNASGVAGVLELARLIESRKPKLNHRVELVAYCLEEPPFFGSSEMGSAVHAKSLKAENAKVDLMLSLEVIGYYSEEKNSQEFPIQGLEYIYPTTGNFIAVAGDMNSISLTKKVKSLMAENSKIDVQYINAPRSVPGMGLSDHFSYWNEGFPALMITDTAFFRNPNYHTVNDRPETLNYEKMAEVVEGVYGVLSEF